MKKFDDYNPDTNSLIEAKDWKRWAPNGNRSFDKMKREEEVTPKPQ